MKNIFIETGRFFSNLPMMAYDAFDIRDLLVFGGLGLMGYGLWLYIPWVGFAVSGFVLMLIGYLMRGK